MMKLSAPAALMLLLAGCGDGPDARGPADAPPAGPPFTEQSLPGDTAPELAPLPADSIRPRARSVPDTLMIEGMPEVITARLTTGPGDDLPFSTYLPEGLDAEVVATGDSAAVSFGAAFGGVRNPNAYMHVRAYPPGTSAPMARDVIGGFLRSRRPADNPVTPPEQEAWEKVEPPAWGVDAYSFSYRMGAVNYVGRIVIGRHGPRFFHVLTHYPAEYGDGLGPRFDRILHWWRWEDTGRPLRGTQGG